MPLYLYRCKKCEAEEEHIQKFSDPPVTKCETCGGKLEKVITPTAFHLKGGGWYKDLYASNKPSEAGVAGSATDSAGGSSSDSDKGSGGDKGGDKSSDTSKKKKKSGKKAASK